MADDPHRTTIHPPQRKGVSLHLGEGICDCRGRVRGFDQPVPDLRTAQRFDRGFGGQPAVRLGAGYRRSGANAGRAAGRV